MGLKPNGSRNHYGSLQFFGATMLNGASLTVNQPPRWGAKLNTQIGEAGFSQLTSVPDGVRHPYAIVMPMKAGGLSARNNVLGSGSISTNILAVKLAEAGLTGSGDLEAVGSLIVQLIADLVGSGEISVADLKAFLQLAADISGSGEVSDAVLTGIGALVAALLGDGTAADSILTGRGAMAADLVVTGTGLTTGNVGQAVWSALAASNNATGTMGEKLNDAGAAGNPWAALLADNMDADTFGLFVQEVMNAIKAKTDSLSFGVAGKVDANITHVNEVEVGGTGVTGDEWNPV